MSKGSSGQCGGLCVNGTPREDPGMSLGTLQTVWRAVCAWDTQGGSWDIPRQCGGLCVHGTPREDPGMYLGILWTVWRAVCEWDTLGGSWDVPRDPPDSVEGCV